MARLLAAISWIECCYVKSNACLLMNESGRSRLERYGRIERERERVPKRSSYDKLTLKKKKRTILFSIDISGEYSYREKFNGIIARIV